MQLTYFVRGAQTRLIKIGTSTSLTNVFARVAELQKLNCDTLELIAVGRAESESDFNFERSHGSWFQPTAELLAYIELVKSQPVPSERKKDYSVRERIHEKFGYVPVVPPLKLPKPCNIMGLVRPFQEIQFKDCEAEEKVG